MLETYSDAAAFYESLSTQDLKTALRALPSDNAVKRTLCDSPEWAYVIAEFMPKIRELNKRRPKDNPVIVTAIDSMVYARPFLFPAPGAENHDFDFGKYQASSNIEYRSGCSAKGVLPIWAASRNRERETALNFSRFIKRLGTRGKALVRYHQGHLARKSTSCSPEWIDTNRWIVKRGPLTWLQIYEQMAAHDPLLLPKESLKTILIDEIDNSYNPHGVTRVAARQAARLPGQSFALKLRLDDPASLGSGSDLFFPDSLLTSYNQVSHGTAKLSERFNGLIFNLDADRAAVLRPQAAAYLPGLCSQIGPT